MLSGHPDFAPFMYNENGKSQGILPEFAEKVLADLKIQCERKDVGPWSRVQEMAEMGRLDLIAGLYKSPRRMQYLDFLEPEVIENEVVLFVKKGSQLKYKDWNSLKGKTIGRIIGDNYAPEFEEFLKQNKSEVTQDFVKTLEQNILKLNAGRIDGIIYSKSVGNYRIKKMGLDAQITNHDKPIFVGKFYLAVSKKGKLKGIEPELSKKIIQLKKKQLKEIIKAHMQMI